MIHFFIDDKIVGKYSVGYAWFEMIQLCKFTPGSNNKSPLFSWKIRPCSH